MFVNYSYVFTRYDTGVNGSRVPAYFWIELAFLCHPLVKKLQNQHPPTPPIKGSSVF